MPRPWPPSAAAWMGCHWPSSWLRLDACPDLPPALLDRLEQRLLLLTGGCRDLPGPPTDHARCHRLEFHLLAESEQTLFRRLAVFAGSFSLEAVNAVAGARGMPDGAILEGIAVRVNTSLLQTRKDLDGEPRYQMLETIREYGLEQLAASGEAEELRRHHADYALGLAQAGAAALGGAAQGDWLTRLEVEQANLRAALAWLPITRQGRPDCGSRRPSGCSGTSAVPTPRPERGWRPSWPKRQPRCRPRSASRHYVGGSSRVSSGTRWRRRGT